MTTAVLERKITVAEIRAKFPHPRVANDRNEGRANYYCIAGALVLSWRNTPLERATTRERFPDRDVIAQVLREANPVFEGEGMTMRAQYQADCITQSNDEGKFGTSWQYLNLALTWDGNDPGDLTPPRIRKKAS